MKIFTYGSLKRGEPNHSVLKDINAKFLGSDITVKKYPLFELREPFPYLQNEKDIGHFIKGEVYEIPNDKRSILDEFEGVPDLYTLGIIKLKKYKDVFVYFKAKNIKLDNIKLLDSWSLN